ncbi:MAG: hypothetical protein ACRD5K_12890 [Candidatus Acidiferrales bacterium]
MKSSGLFATAVMLFGFFGLFGSSGRTFHLTPGKMVPAATGTVNVTKDKDNGNLRLDIKVKHLALPGSLTPPANNYVVWLEPRGHGGPVKQGAIGLDGELEGELKTITTSKNFNVVVTAEKSEAVMSPSQTVVLEGHVAD